MPVSGLYLWELMFEPCGGLLPVSDLYLWELIFEPCGGLLPVSDLYLWELIFEPCGGLCLFQVCTCGNTSLSLVVVFASFRSVPVGTHLSGGPGGAAGRRVELRGQEDWGHHLQVSVTALNSIPCRL